RRYPKPSRDNVRLNGRRVATLAMLGGLSLMATACVPSGPAGAAGPGGLPIPRVSVGVDQSTAPGDVSTGLQIVFLLTILTLAPSLLIMVTSFTRTVIVLSLVRNAMGIPQLPPNQVLVGLSLFLTFFVMAPTWNQINHDALQPYLTGDIKQSDAIDKASSPIR